MLGSQIDQRELVLSLIGPRKNRPPINLEQINWRSTVTDEICVGESHAQFNAGSIGLPAELTEQLQSLRRRKITPAVFLEIGSGHVVTEPVVCRPAGLR